MLHFFSVSVVQHIFPLFLLFSNYFCTLLENTVLVYSFSFHPMLFLPYLTFFSCIFPVNPCPTIFNTESKWNRCWIFLMGQTEPKDSQSTYTFSTSADKCPGFYSLCYGNLLISLTLYNLSLFKRPQLNWIVNSLSIPISIVISFLNIGLCSSYNSWCSRSWISKTEK